MTLVAETLDLQPMVESLTVLDKKKQVVAFEPNWAQKQILAQVKKDYESNRATRIICLKARQIGISTITEAIIFCKAVMFPHTEAVVASLDTEQAEYLFDMTKRFYDNWEFKKLYPPKYTSKRQLFLQGVESDINVKTGENPKAFRGRTYTDAHVSEVAFYTKPVEMMLALNQGMPAVRGNFQLIESTANGIGNHFEAEYWKAKKGESDYVAFFFPWFKHYEYIACRGEGCTDGTCGVCLSATDGFKARDAEERALLKMGATKAHLAWRRWAIPNLCQNNLDLFHQEYPSTDREAFLASGVNAFNLDDLDEVYVEQKPDVGRFVVSSAEVKFITDPDGGWRVYKYPPKEEGEERWGEYFIGADPSYGTMDGDFAAAQIINRRTLEQVATYQGRVAPGAFGDELALAGKFYNMATIAPETEGGGIATIERLRHIYPRLYQRRSFDVVPGQDRSERMLGWSTNWKTKAELITTASEIVQRGKCILHDENTYHEMRKYSFYSGRGLNDKFGPGDKEAGRDDLVMSWCIAVVCESQESPLNAYEVTQSEPGSVIWSKEQTEEEGWQ